jgi:phage-related protein
MKDVIWISGTLQVVKEYPINVRREIGYNLDRVQRGIEPCDWKSMVSIGHGVKEIRIHEENEYRVLYVAKFEEAIYVLHSFLKKTQQTAKRDIQMAKKRYAEVLEMRRVYYEKSYC